MFHLINNSRYIFLIKLMSIEFDMHTFHAIKVKNNIYVKVTDVRDFINKNMQCASILNMAINIYNKYQPGKLEHCVYWTNDGGYIYWKYIPMLTMMFNKEKYERYQHILEYELGYKLNEMDIKIIE